MNCTICQQPVILVPSAEERAKKDVTGKTAAYYRGLFTEHAKCTLQKRHEVTTESLREHREAIKHINPADVWALSQVGSLA